LGLKNDDEDNDSTEFFEVHITTRANMQSDIHIVEGDMTQWTGIDRVLGIKGLV
jgi:hypothetical protein